MKWRLSATSLLKEVPISLEGKVIVGLKWDDPDVVDDLERVIKENNVNIVLPFLGGAIEIASILKERLPEVFVPVSDFLVTSALFDKVEAAKASEKAKLPIPLTYSVLSAEMLTIVKPRKGARREGYTSSAISTTSCILRIWETISYRNT